MDTVQTLKAATARMGFRGQMTFLGVMLAAIATSNVFTTIADRARDGVHLAAWKPVSWEFSSVICIWLLLPATATIASCCRQYVVIAAGGYKDSSTRGDYVIAYALPR